MRALQRAVILTTLAALASPVAAQSFTEELLLQPGVPGANVSTTDNIDFADIDRDGDWDIAMADGGDSGNDQNRVWMNLGGLQGGLVGTFADETATRFPVLNDTGRDIEFADIDADDDLDLHLSNTASVSAQGCRWWVNQGGEQGGSLGFYADETGARWVGLGGPGSSIPAALLYPGGTPETFIDWSCDSDFGDLDNDGDLDLVHSSYGGAFSGTVPTRLFLNDGGGYFEEFNPSGFQLSSVAIPDGAPGLWCEGVQTHDTTATDGSACDIASSPEDIDVGDFDGDLDLDILHGSINSSPRFFTNRTMENGGALSFRDTTGAAFAPGAVGTSGNYDQQAGDLDNDDDLDIFGLNWSPVGLSFEDQVMWNDSAAAFTASPSLPNSLWDDQACDLIDYDNDGDLDALIASWGGDNRLYRNDGASFADATSELPVVAGHVSMDVEVADFDNDGDYDFVEASDSPRNNRFYVNRTQVPDTTAPRLAKLESVVGHAAVANPDVVRVQVYDNVPSTLLYFDEVRLEVSVDGVALPSLAMQASGGQIFRGEVPGNLVGAIEYHAVASDPYGNSSASPPKSYTNTGPLGTSQGTASPGPLGLPDLRALSSPIAEAPLYLATSNATPGALGWYLFSLSGTLPGIDLGNGAVLNLNVPFAIPPIAGQADASGDLLLAVSNVPASLSGLTLHTQCILADGAAPNLWSSSRSLSLSFP